MTSMTNGVIMNSPAWWRPGFLALLPSVLGCAAAVGAPMDVPRNVTSLMTIGEADVDKSVRLELRETEPRDGEALSFEVLLRNAGTEPVAVCPRLQRSVTWAMYVYDKSGEIDVINLETFAIPARQEVPLLLPPGGFLGARASVTCKWLGGSPPSPVWVRAEYLAKSKFCPEGTTRALAGWTRIHKLGACR
jgi:hypothetical protein